jgi:hypothetical protein
MKRESPPVGTFCATGKAKARHNLPQVLKPLMELRQWVNWRWKWVTRKDGTKKRTKVPYQPNGLKAKTNDQSTWSTFEAVVAASSRFDGIGIVVRGFGAFDIDDCRNTDTGELHEWAQQLVDEVGTYCEVTVSGTGLRLIGTGEGAELHRKIDVVDGVSCEVYRNTARYIVVTGASLGTPAPVINIDAALERTVEKLDAAKRTKKAKSKAKGGKSKDKAPSFEEVIKDGHFDHWDNHRRQALWYAACSACRAGWSDEKIVEALVDPDNKISEKVLEQPDPRTYAEELVARAREETSRPLIRIVAGELDRMATEAETALIMGGAPFYVRGGELVQPVIDEVDASHGRRTKAARLIPVTYGAMVDWLCRVSDWERFNVKVNDWLPADPSAHAIAVLLSRKGEWRFPVLAGVITCQTLRPDGSLFDQPGYDPDTRMLLLEPPAMPAIPELPTRQDAEQALELLKELIKEFPFVNEVSRAVALSGLITPVVRGAMSVAPAHVSRAHVAGSGKSYLNDLIAGIASGHRCPVIAAGQTEEETEKRLVAKLLAGDPIISIDNLNGEFQGDFLCQMIERGTVDARPLGRSERVRVENRCTILANGNNLVPVKDVVRRLILCDLDAKVERPELREFKARPFETIIADRGTYVAAVLTICRAYIASGRPGRLPHLASFEAWSDLVRSALVWLGEADPVDSIETARADDPDLRNQRALMGVWAEVFGGRFITVNELVAAAELSVQKGAMEWGFKHEELNDVLTTITNGRGIDAKTISHALRRWKGRIVEGRSFVEDKSRKVPRWGIEGSGAPEEGSETGENSETNAEEVL